MSERANSAPRGREIKRWECPEHGPHTSVTLPLGDDLEGTTTSRCCTAELALVEYVPASQLQMVAEENRVLSRALSLMADKVWRDADAAKDMYIKRAGEELHA